MTNLVIVQKPKTEKSSGKKNLSGKQFTIFHEAEHYITEKYLLQRNVVTTDFEIKGIRDTQFKLLNESQLYVELQKNGINISEQKLIALLKSDFVKTYNPFVDYFENLPKYKSSTDYIKNLSDYIQVKRSIHPEVDNQQRFNNHFKKWLVRTVKCALVDDYFNKNALILVQNKQNSGKSTFCRFLCPPGLADYIKENLTTDKDGYISMTRNLLINLDELSTLSKQDVDSLKTLFSKDKINERLPYERKNSIIPRRCSFIGSTNNNEFLTDLTGSVRWLCFDIVNINFDYKIKVRIDAVYAQAYYLYKTGFDCELTKDEINENEEINEFYQITPPEMEIIQKYYRPGTKDDNQAFYAAADFIRELSDKNLHVKINTRNFGKLLNKLGFIKDQRWNGHYQIKGYYINFIYE